MSRLTRRAMLSSLGALGVLPAGAAGGATLPPEAGLKDHAARAGLVYGASIAAESLPVPDCLEVYGRETAIVTTDLELKFASLRPERAVFSFGPADAIIDWALKSGMLVRGHTLIWNEYNGDWLKRCSASEIAYVFDQHIDRVVSRYAGRIHCWDVINEPFWPDHGAPGGYRRGPWYDALGPGYIARALKRVRALDASVRLCINEAHCDYDNAWGRGIRPCLARLVADLRHDGVPLDAVGLECHLQPAFPHDYAAFAGYARRLTESGVDLHLTELDIDDAIFPDSIGRRDQMVAVYVGDFLKHVLDIPALKMVINWELIDKWSGAEHTALSQDPRAARLPRPLPYDDDLQRKPLWSAMAAAFDARAASRS